MGDVVSSDADSTAGLKGEGSAVETYHSSSVVCAQALSENAHSTSDAIVSMIRLKFCSKAQHKVVRQRTVQLFDLFTILLRQLHQIFVLMQLHALPFLNTMAKIDWFVGQMVILLQMCRHTN